MPIGSPPTSEKGTTQDPRAVRHALSGLGRSWSNFFEGDTLEHVPELKWKPDGRGWVSVAHSMRSDAQIQGLYLGSTLPIRRYNWHILPNGADDRTIQGIADDLGLMIKGQEDRPRGRSKRRFSWSNHLRHLLLALIYGHMYFEQVGEIGADGLWHLRKLAPRMPQSIHEIRTERDGGLKSIVQNVQTQRNSAGMWNTNFTELPVERLVAYVWEQEGANWTGRPMTRGIHKNWLLKDVVLRVGAINIERAGGVPYITAPRGATDGQMDELAEMAQQFRVGEEAGGAIPFGAELKLAQAAGGEEAVNYIKLQNEEMGRGWLMMFMNLGQTTSGSRALGGSFIDFFSMAQETIADWIVDVVNEHIIEDWVDWNIGEDAPAPLIGYSRNDDRQLAVADLVEMIQIGLVQMDDEMENWIREEYKMPRRLPNASARAVLRTAAQVPAEGAPASPALGRSAALRDLEEV